MTAEDAHHPRPRGLRLNDPAFPPSSSESYPSVPPNPASPHLSSPPFSSAPPVSVALVLSRSLWPALLPTPWSRQGPGTAWLNLLGLFPGKCGPNTGPEVSNAT